MLDSFLSAATPGRARLLLCEHVADALSALEAWAEARTPSIRVVTLSCDPLPGIRELLSGALDAIAEVGLRLWPAWAEGHTTGPWGGRAAALARAGKLPLPRGFTRRQHVRHLARACRAPDLLLVLATGDDTPPPERLAGLARGAEWLAREAWTPVVAVAPVSVGASAALEPIAYERCVWEPPSSAAPAPDGAGEEHAVVRVWPVVGQPHPFSPGEQLLARALADDAQLAPLFAFNQRVCTRRGSAYLVDLVWEEGRVAVEIDGYAHHSNRYAFARDRLRDYELLISGYLVLRIPHDEVVEDVRLVVEKVRDVVAFRRAASGEAGGARHA